MSSIFNLPPYARKTKYIRSCISALQKFRESLSLYTGEEEPSGISDEQLELAIGNAEHLALALRSLRERYAYFDPDITDWSLEVFDSLPVEIRREDNVIRILAPWTFRRIPGNTYNLTAYICAALARHIAEQGELWHMIEPPLHQIVKRKSHEWNRQCFCDNDSQELKSMVNEIYVTLGYSDSARNTSYTSVYQKCEEGEDGMEIVIFPESMIAEMITEIQTICE